MTVRLCVIGNSHVAALKLGWDQLIVDGDPRIAALVPTFFGAPRDGIKHVALREGLLLPLRADVRAHFQRLSGGLSEINPAHYDAFLLVGLGASLKRVLRLYRTHRWAGVGTGAGQVLVSRAFAAAFLAEGYSATRLALMAGLLGQVADKPIHAAPEPHWAAIQPTGAERKPDFGWARAAAAGEGPALAGMFAEALRAALDPKVSMILQPAATLEAGIVTRAAFNKGASRLISGDGEDSDAAHMNADYGALWWAEAAGIIAPAKVARRASVRRRAG